MDKISKFGQDSPMKRPGQPAGVAPAFVFLASDEASYIFGEVLGVTGGKPLPCPRRAVGVALCLASMARLLRRV